MACLSFSLHQYMLDFEAVLTTSVAELEGNNLISREITTHFVCGCMHACMCISVSMSVEVKEQC